MDYIIPHKTLLLANLKYNQNLHKRIHITLILIPPNGEW